MKNETATSSRDWRLLWSANGISVLADGVFIAALPLAAAAITSDPSLVAGMTVASTLPWLVFSLYAGAIADRSDPRRLLVFAQGIQLVVTALIGITVTVNAFAGSGIWAYYVLAFALGMAMTLVKSASQTLLPAVVAKERLIGANGQLFTVQSVSQYFLGPTVGAALFAAAPFLPFWGGAAAFAVSMALNSLMSPPKKAAARKTRNLHGEIREGIRFMWNHRMLRTMTVLVAVSNFSLFMGLSTLVLYVGSHIYGVVLSASAAGSILTGLASKRIIARFGGFRVVRVAILTTPLMLACVGLFGPNPWVVCVLMSISSAGVMLWNVAAVSQRQQLTPPELQGRVSSAGTMLAFGAQPLGALAGGLTADALGLGAPWIVAGALRLAFVVLLMHTLRAWKD